MTDLPTMHLDPIQPGRRRPSTGMIIGIVIGALVLILVALIALGAGAANPSANTGGSGDVLATSGATPTTATNPAPDPVVTPPATTTTTTAAADDSTIVVPNGVGKDYQSAQDLWRGAGLHVLPAKDATGAHRLPVIDSNWVVLSQDPAAGSRVAKGSFITATVKKYTDG